LAFLYEYGLFIAKAITIVISILVVVGGIIALASKQKQGKGNLDISSISDKLQDVADHARELMLSKDELKQYNKDKKKQAKQKANKNDDQKNGRVFVIDFDGSMDAHEVENLREEVTTVLNVANKDDHVLVRLESGGGVVHGYGLAASQLQRIKDKGLNLTVSVDKVAASGGYMMACVADQVLSAKFAIIGSIGVIAQLPNFNKLLQKSHIEFEQHTAGDFKRTLTMFGENNDQGREKFKQELEEVHQMFKGFVSEHRPQLDIDKVATGEYWYGAKALELGLVDKIQTSDDYLLGLNQEHEIFSVQYRVKKNIAEKFGLAASQSLQTAAVKLMTKGQSLFR
jgi:serine protease SohB